MIRRARGVREEVGAPTVGLSHQARDRVVILEQWVAKPTRSSVHETELAQQSRSLLNLCQGQSHLFIRPRGLCTCCPSAQSLGAPLPPSISTALSLPACLRGSAPTSPPQRPSLTPLEKQSPLSLSTPASCCIFCGTSHDLTKLYTPIGLLRRQ